MGTRSCSTGRGSAARAGWTAATSCSSSRSSCTAGAAGGSMMPAWSFAGGCRLWDGTDGRRSPTDCRWSALASSQGQGGVPGGRSGAAGALAGGLPLPRRRASQDEADVTSSS